MRLIDMLRGLAELEQAAADLYEWYAQIFDDDPEAVHFFRDIAKQELDHRNLVDFQLRIVARNSDSFTDIAESSDEIDAARRAVDKHMREGIFELADALEFALWLESTAAEMHHGAFIAESNPQIAKLVSSLASADDEHKKSIEAFAARVTGNPTRTP